MKILFLDIDGVLNPVHYENMLHKMWKTSGGLIKSKDKYGNLFFNQSVSHLKRIVWETGCSIVISSTWRLEGQSKLVQMWVSRNLPGDLYDITPIRNDANRGKEISMWLTHYIHDNQDDDVKYSILDDRTITGHRGHFVQPNGYYGLTSEDADAVIKILNK